MVYPTYRGRGSRTRATPYSNRPANPSPQISEPCIIYTRTGRCDQKPTCRYQHTPRRTALCQQFLKSGRCSTQGNEHCTLSHEPVPENAPMCVHFARGNCTNSNCQFTHMKQLGAHPEQSPTCRTFAINGWCERGQLCTKRHTFECPDFEAYQTCPNPNCVLQHVITAKQTAATPVKPAEVVRIPEFLEFLRTATRESCNMLYLPDHQPDNVASDAESSSSSDSDSDIDWTHPANEPPLDTGADFIAL